MSGRLITLEERTRPDGGGDALGNAVRKDVDNFFFGIVLYSTVEEEETQREESRVGAPPKDPLRTTTMGAELPHEGAPSPSLLAPDSFEPDQPWRRRPDTRTLGWISLLRTRWWI